MTTKIDVTDLKTEELEQMYDSFGNGHLESREGRTWWVLEKEKEK